MATTSGSYSFNYGRDQIIKSALRKLGAIASGETPDNNTIQDCADQLNILVKAWNASGIHIWTEEEATLFLQPAQVSYTLGGTTTDQAAWGNPGYVATTLSSAAASGATSISVGAITGIANGNNIGIVLTSGTIFWTTVSGAPSGTTVNLTAGLSGAAASGNAVYAYATAVQRPLRVVSGRRYNFASAIDTPLIDLSRLDYRNLPNKTTTGKVTQWFYDPRGGANNQGIISVWPAPADATDGIKFTWFRSIQDFNTAGNIADLPTEWINALVLSLAYAMALEYDVPPQRYAIIQQQAAEALDLAMGWDREDTSTFFGVNFDQR